MSLVVVLSVTWLTLVAVVLGACVAAGRADRDAVAQTRRSVSAPAGIDVSLAPIAPMRGASAPRTNARQGLGRAPRRGAHHAARHARLLRR